MKRLFIIAQVLMLMTASCATYEKGRDKENMPSLEPPKALEDNWSRWLVGNWQGTAKSDFGEHKDWVKGSCQMNIELALKGQFVVHKGRSQITSLSDEYIKQVKG